jgi:hypothetical protein
MKFTIDLENRKILIHSPFSKSQLEEVLSIINVNDKDNWLIDIYTDQNIDYSYTTSSGFLVTNEYS